MIPNCMGMKRSQAAQWAASTFFTKCSMAISVEGRRRGVATGPRHLRKTQELGEDSRPAPHLTLPLPRGPEAVLSDPPWGNRGVL